MSMVMSVATRKKKKKKKTTFGGGSSNNNGGIIKIKPFRCPPSLPVNFYHRSKDILKESMDCILNRNIGNRSSSGSSSSSREELYQMVQDLCNHSFGPTLYDEVISILQDASLISIQRLPTQVRSCRTSSCTTMESLESIWNMWMEYMEYIHYVRSIFLHLDRLFVFLPPCPTTATTTHSTNNNNWWKNGRIVPRSGLHNTHLEQSTTTITSATSGDSTTDKPNNESNNNSNNNNNNNNITTEDSSTRKVMMNGTTTTGTGNVVSNCYWTLWEVGIHSLLTHLLSDENFVILETLQDGTIYQLVQELNSYRTILTDTTTSITAATSSSSPSNSMIIPSASTLHQPLVRNCVTMIRTLGSTITSTVVTSHHGGSKYNSVTEKFLQKVESSMTTYFTAESSEWMMTNHENSSHYDVRKLLQHMDARLKQVHSMTLYYLLTGTTTSGNQDNHATINSNNNNNNNSSRHNILTRVVEEYLVTPHFTSTYILHPKYLYPLLDDESKIIPDVRRLYSMSKRVIPTTANTILTNNDTSNSRKNNLLLETTTTNTTSTTTDHPSSTVVTGTDHLRMAFRNYGKERGLNLVQMKTNPQSNRESQQPSPPTTSASLTNNNIKQTIIPSLLSLIEHLELLNKKAFFANNNNNNNNNSNESFGRCIRTLLEEVVNSGLEEEDDDDHKNSLMTTTSRRHKQKMRRNNNNSLQQATTGGDGGKLVAELLAKYIDSRFSNINSNNNYHHHNYPFMAHTTTNLKVTDNNMEKFQSQVLDLFRHIHAKDVFEAFYKRDLANRLLSKNKNMDVERSFVSLLKAECGSVYTAKMTGMFKDMDLSTDVMSSYCSSHQNNNENLASQQYSMDMDVQVLTTGYWPVYPQYPNIVLPPSLMAHKEQFENYYKSKYQGRRIVWQHSLGNCIVKSNFPKLPGQRELVVSLLQAVTLLCFNDDNTNDNNNGYTILDVMTKTGIDDRSEVERVLLSLSTGRQTARVLTKIPPNNMIINTDTDTTTTLVTTTTTISSMIPDPSTTESSTSTPKRRKPKKIDKKSCNSILDQDRFLFNEDFINKRQRINLIQNYHRHQSSSSTTEKDRKKTCEAVNRDRQALTDAVIVRIMKARKRLEHSGLISEAMSQLRFATTGTDIKMRIETLMEREYIARAEGDRTTYVYLA